MSAQLLTMNSLPFAIEILHSAPPDLCVQRYETDTVIRMMRTIQVSALTLSL